MNYAKLSVAAIVGGAGCVKGNQPWSSPALSTTLTTPHGWEPSDLCSGKWPTTRRGGGRQGNGPSHLVTGGLSWRDTPVTTSTLFITVIYRGHRQGDLSWSEQPRRNIITEQRLSEELPFQHSVQVWLLLFCKMLCVLKSGVWASSVSAGVFVLWNYFSIDLFISSKTSYK